MPGGLGRILPHLHERLLQPVSTAEADETARALLTVRPRSDSGKRSSLACSSSALTLTSKGFGSRFQPYAFGKQAGDRGVETEGVHEGRDWR
jgi:hypothetical protein